MRSGGTWPVLSLQVQGHGHKPDKYRHFHSGPMTVAKACSEFSPNTATARKIHTLK
jgi:hypothetical protein